MIRIVGPIAFTVMSDKNGIMIRLQSQRLGI